MKKVVLLGDSIRLIGYGKYVPQLLGDEYQIWQPTDNCRFSSYTLRMLFDHKKDLEDAEIIHWNNGLWDATLCMGDAPFTPLDVYVATMKRIAENLIKITDKVIFATTTPVPDSNIYDKNAVINMYNEAIVPVLADMGIYINDLNSVISQNIDENICEDLLHLSDRGAQLCAREVVKAIKTVESSSVLNHKANSK